MREGGQGGESKHTEGIIVGDKEERREKEKNTQVKKGVKERVCGDQ